MSLRINDEAPNFSAETTQGNIDFHEWIGDGWAILKWYHGGYLRDQIRPGMHIAASGKVGLYREAIQMTNPRHQILWDIHEFDDVSISLFPMV